MCFHALLVPLSVFCTRPPFSCGISCTFLTPGTSLVPSVFSLSYPQIMNLVSIFIKVHNKAHFLSRSFRWMCIFWQHKWLLDEGCRKDFPNMNTIQKLLMVAWLSDRTILPLGGTLPFTCQKFYYNGNNRNAGFPLERGATQHSYGENIGNSCKKSTWF